MRIPHGDGATRVAGLSRQSKAKLDPGGVEDEPTAQLGRNCLLARRLVGRGVRFAEIVHASWDNHPEFKQGTEKESLGTDSMAAALAAVLGSVACSARLKLAGAAELDRRRWWRIERPSAR